MIERRENLWAVRADWLCFTSNGERKSDGAAVMGAGCAREARDRFPGIDARLGTLLASGGNHVHDLGIWTVDGAGERRVLSLPTKHRWRDASDIDLIRRSCRELRALACKYASPDGGGWALPVVALPRPGCHNGRLGWAVVKPVVEEELPEPSFVVVSL